MFRQVSINKNICRCYPGAQAVDSRLWQENAAD